LIAARLARLVALQAEVLADRDPEPLHQMRVSIRRLRGILEQFGSALVLPDAADPARIARIGRRLGLTRDLDVLRQRLDQQLIPLLSDREVQQLKPLFKQLRRERRLAFEELTETLQGRRYLKLLAQLQGWLKAPRFTAMGEEPLGAWGQELLQAVTSGLTMEAGWWLEAPHGPEAAVALHRLRRRIKRARYGLSHLEPLAPAVLAPWLERLRRMQDLLGDLNDLQLIESALHHALDAPPDQLVPGLCSVLMEQRGQSWQLWRDQAALLQPVAARAALHGLLAGTPSPTL
jgi:CHAD domain-containing protein